MYREVLPGEKIRVAFLFQIASFWPSWESLHSLLLRDTRFQIRLFLVKDDVDKAKQLQTAESFLIASGIDYVPFSDESFAAFAPHVAVLQTPYDYTQREHHLYAARLKREGIRVVYIPYGIEIVDTRAARHNHFRESTVLHAWRIYTMSESFRREYEKYCPNAKAVRGFGLPRFDMLRQRGRFPLSEAVKERARGRKIVVWKTHFAKKIDVDGEKRQVTPYLEDYISFAGSLPDYADHLFFVFCAHPRFGDDVVDAENNERSRRLFELLQPLENVYTDAADDYRPALLNADAIIIDRSALAVEAGTVGVPVLYLKNPDCEEPPFPPLAALFDSYEQGTGVDDMRRFVEHFLAGKLAPREIAAFPNFDGKCAERIADDLAASVNVPEPERPPRRLILFGTGFIYRLMRKITVFPDGCEIVALADNDQSKWGTRIDGVLVVPPGKINDFSFDKVIICAENIFEEEIMEQLMFQLEIPSNKIARCEYLALL